MNQEEQVRQLVLLIDDTLQEFEQLKKSERFKAAEISLDGPGEKLSNMDSNGDLGKEEHEDEEQDDKRYAKKDHDHKVECEVVKAEDEEDDEEEKKKKKAEPEDEKEEEKDEPMQKSKKANAESLMKSMIDARIAPLEAKLDKLADMFSAFADAPRPSKSSSYKDVAPLAKSESVETLNKSQVLSKLFDLKKSGASVDSADIASVEINPSSINDIISKYNLK